MRLLLDEHISNRIADELRNAGYDVIAVVERPDLRGRPDETLIEVALTESRAFVTFDIADHVGIYSSSVRLATPHPGLVLLATSKLQPSGTGIGALVADRIHTNARPRRPWRRLRPSAIARHRLRCRRRPGS